MRYQRVANAVINAPRPRRRRSGRRRARCRRDRVDCIAGAIVDSQSPAAGLMRERHLQPRDGASTQGSINPQRGRASRPSVGTGTAGAVARCGRSHVPTRTSPLSYPRECRQALRGHSSRYDERQNRQDTGAPNVGFDRRHTFMASTHGLWRFTQPSPAVGVPAAGESRRRAGPSRTWVSACA